MRKPLDPPLRTDLGNHFRANRNSLYYALFPTTWIGWLGFSLAMLIGFAGTLFYSGVPAGFLLALLLCSWLINLAVIPFSIRVRFICHLFTWVVLWRATLNDQPVYRVVLASLVTAGAVVWAQEWRKTTAGPAG